MFKPLVFSVVGLMIGNAAAAFEGQITGTIDQRYEYQGPRVNLNLKVFGEDISYKSSGTIAKKYVLSVTKHQGSQVYPVLRSVQPQPRPLPHVPIIKPDWDKFRTVKGNPISSQYSPYIVAFVYENLSVQGNVECQEDTNYFLGDADFGLGTVQKSECSFNLTVTSTSMPSVQDISGLLEFLPTHTAKRVRVFDID